MDRPSTTSGRQIAETVLGRLLDRVETKPDRQNRVIERLPKVSLLYDEREELIGLLKRAEAGKAVELVYGRRELRDHIEQVVLLDPGPLYAILGRRVPFDVAAEAGAALSARLGALPLEISSALDKVVAGWAERRNVVRGLGPDDLDAAVGAFRAAAALFGRRQDDGMDIRTFSRRVTGNSKFVEGNMGRIADVLRMAETLPDYLDAEEVLAFHGIQKWSLACLVAGPVTYKGSRLPTEPYIGVAPEMTPLLGVDGRPDWMLTVENLASFNRQVREAAHGGIVVYTGGFPSDAVLSAIVGLARAGDFPVYHWGDIDAGGVKIAYRIEQALAREGRRLLLHMMEPALAAAHGSPAAPTGVFKDLSAQDSVVAEAVRYLASPEAHHLEQEELDPRVPG